MARAVATGQLVEEAAKEGIDLIRNGTEHPYTGKTVDGREAHRDKPKEGEQGVYVSAVSGLPLFSTRHSVEGEGWPNFSCAIDPEHVIEREDLAHGMQRSEVLDAKSGAHLGHVYEDEDYRGRACRRYCINASVLRFVARGEVRK